METSEYLNEYNTERKPLILKEYGRNVQKLAEYVTQIEDPEKRTSMAHTLVDLMKQVTPTVKDTTENAQKLWDDLFIMTNFKLEIESPFPKPDVSILNRKPQIVPYKEDEIRYKHYGRNLELMIQKATELENEEEKEAAVIYIGKMMKAFYTTWNKDNVDDKVIVQNIKELSKNQLVIDVDKVKENNLFEIQHQYKERPQRPKQKRPYSGGSSRKRKN